MGRSISPRRSTTAASTAASERAASAVVFLFVAKTKSPPEGGLLVNERCYEKTLFLFIRDQMRLLAPLHVFRLNDRTVLLGQREGERRHIP